MAIKYSIVAHKNPDTGEVRAYAQVVNEKFSFDDLCKQATAETTVTEADVKAVVSAVLMILQREVLKGNTICLQGLGTLYATLSGEGAEEAKKFVPSMIKRVNLRFMPDTKLKKELAKAKFEIAPTKKLSKAAIKDMKDLVQEAIDGGGDDEPTP